jgi:hypothetical protein
MRSSSLSLWTLFRHRLTAYWRTPVLGRRLVSFLLSTVLRLSLAVPLAVVGVFFDDIVGHLAPNARPLLVAARGILPVALSYGGSRMVIDSGLAVAPRPYQALPISRSAIVRLLSVFALLSLWNVVPMAFVVPVCIDAAAGGDVGAALRFGLACVGVLAAVTYGVPMLRKAMAARPLTAMSAVFLAGGGSGLASLFGIDLFGLLLSSSEQLFAGIVRGNVLPVTAGVGGLAGVVLGHMRWLKGMMAVDRRADAPLSLGRLGSLNFRARRRPAVQEALLVLRLLTRNSLPRFTLLWVYPLYLSMVALSVATDRNPVADFGGQSLATWAIGTGMFSIFVAQQLFNYLGPYFQGLATRPIPVRTRVKGHLLFFVGGATLLFLIPLPAAIWEPSFLLVHTAFFLYNVGITTPVLLAAAPFAREAFPPHRWTTSGVDFSGTRFVLYLGVTAGAFLPLLLLDDPVHQLYVIGGIGLAACTAMPLWIRGLTALYRRNRYPMLEGFQASRDEH